MEIGKYIRINGKGSYLNSIHSLEKNKKVIASCVGFFVIFFLNKKYKLWGEQQRKI